MLWLCMKEFKYYLVEWKSTWVTAESLGNVQETLDTYNATYRHKKYLVQLSYMGLGLFRTMLT